MGSVQTFFPIILDPCSTREDDEGARRQSHSGVTRSSFRRFPVVSSIPNSEAEGSDQAEMGRKKHVRELQGSEHGLTPGWVYAGWAISPCLVPLAPLLCDVALLPRKEWSTFPHPLTLCLAMWQCDSSEPRFSEALHASTYLQAPLPSPLVQEGG